MTVPILEGAYSVVDHVAAFQMIGYRNIRHDDGTDDGVTIAVTVCQVPLNFRVTRTQTVVTEAYDGTTDEMSVGVAADVDLWQDIASCDIGNADTTGGGDSQADAQPGSTFLGRDPQTAAYDLLATLETNSDTTAGEVTVMVFGFFEKHHQRLLQEQFQE